MKPSESKPLTSSNKKGRIIVLSGPTGCGKTTIAHNLVDTLISSCFSISYTTRPPRENEKEGIDYHFISENKFKIMIEKTAFAEWAHVHGNYYGTGLDNLNMALQKGMNIILDIDVQGGLQVKKRFQQVSLFFILPPSINELINRITNRGKDPSLDLKRRFETALLELESSSKYNYIIVNDKLEDAVEEIIGCLKGMKQISKKRLFAKSLMRVLREQIAKNASAESFSFRKGDESYV